MRALGAFLAAVLASVACGAEPVATEAAAPSPRVVPATPAPEAQTGEPPAAVSPAAPLAPDLVLVATCVTSAVEQLGWLATTAHQGAFLRTAIQRADLPDGCASLAGDAHARSFPIAGGGSIVWRAEEPRARGGRAEVELVFECAAGCTERRSTTVTLPARWHCFGWVHGRQHGKGCGPSRAACESARARFDRGSRPTTPCRVRTGAAYCDRHDPGRCFPTPWDCEREVPDGAGHGGRCVKAE